MYSRWLTGTFSFNIQDYVGAALGGAAGGITLVLTRNMDAANAAGGSICATSVLTEGTSTAIRGVYEGMTSTDPPDISPPTPQPTTGAVVKNPFIPSMHNTFVVVGGGGRYSNNQMIK